MIRGKTSPDKPIPSTSLLDNFLLAAINSSAYSLQTSRREQWNFLRPHRQRIWTSFCKSIEGWWQPYRHSWEYFHPNDCWSRKLRPRHNAGRFAAQHEAMAQACWRKRLSILFYLTFSHYFPSRMELNEGFAWRSMLALMLERDFIVCQPAFVSFWKNPSAVFQYVS